MCRRISPLPLFRLDRLFGRLLLVFYLMATPWARPEQAYLGCWALVKVSHSQLHPLPSPFTSRRACSGDPRDTGYPWGEVNVFASHNGQEEDALDRKL